MKKTKLFANLEFSWKQRFREKKCWFWNRITEWFQIPRLCHQRLECIDQKTHLSPAALSISGRKTDLIPSLFSLSRSSTERTVFEDLWASEVFLEIDVEVVGPALALRYETWLKTNQIYDHQECLPWLHPASCANLLLSLLWFITGTREGGFFFCKVGRKIVSY